MFPCFSNPGSEFTGRLRSSVSLDDVSEALRGLLDGQPETETINLIIGISFNKSPGQAVTENDLLHITRHETLPNNYERVIDLLGRTVNNINPAHQSIYCFGFGDATTHYTDVFRFLDEPCNGHQEAVSQYRRFALEARPTEIVSFAPIIRKATLIASQNRGQHHLLVIVASEPVTSSCTRCDQLSTEERNTYDAIRAARDYRLTIVLVGVGNTNANMRNGLGISRCCKHQNFKFVDYRQIMVDPVDQRKQTDFCIAVTENLPRQIRLSQHLSRSILTPDGVPPSVVYQL